MQVVGVKLRRRVKARRCRCAVAQRMLQLGRVRVVAGDDEHTVTSPIRRARGRVRATGCTHGPHTRGYTYCDTKGLRVTAVSR